MNAIKASLKQLFTFDQRLTYALLFRASQAFVGVVTILVITRVFNPDEQGYYYTFASILALQIIFEMGLSFIILQFTGHEFATIQWSAERKIGGPSDKSAEFTRFLAQCVIAYSLIGLAIFILIWPIGLFFFTASHQPLHLAWQLPWLFLCLATALSTLMIPLLSVIEGSGLIVKINQFRTFQNTAGALVMWIAMIKGANLYSIALDPLVCFLIALVWIKFYYPDLIFKTTTGLLAIYRKTPSQCTSSLRWMRDIWPMQWRIAISWISGYFLSQIYTPIIFYYHEATAAGKLGASMTVCNMLSLFAITFMNAHNPEICQLIANKKWLLLRALFKRVFFHALLLTLLVASLILGALLLPPLAFITHRFVSPLEMLLLLLGTLSNYMIGAMALFLRAFKREPFVWVSLIGALLNASLAWWFGRAYGTLGIVLVYFLLSLLYGLPTALWLWRKNTAHLWTGNINHAFH